MLPGSVNELLKARFPKWRPKRLLDMDAGDQQLWLKGPNGKACPGIAIGHFENADELSYAVLLVPQSNPGGGHKIVVFGKTKDVYSVRLLDQAEGRPTLGLSFPGQGLANTTTGRTQNLSRLNWMGFASSGWNKARSSTIGELVATASFRSQISVAICPELISYTYDPVGNRLSSLGVSPYSVNVSN